MSQARRRHPGVASRPRLRRVLVAAAACGALLVWRELRIAGNERRFGLP